MNEPVFWVVLFLISVLIFISDSNSFARKMSEYRLKKKDKDQDNTAQLADDFSDQFTEWLGGKIYKRQNIGYVVCVKGSKVIGCINRTFKIHKDRDKAIRSLRKLQQPEYLEVRKITFDYKY